MTAKNFQPDNLNLEVQKLTNAASRQQQDFKRHQKASQLQKNSPAITIVEDASISNANQTTSLFKSNRRRSIEMPSFLKTSVILPGSINNG